MKVTLKLVATFMLGVIALTAFHSYLVVRGQVAQYEHEQEDYARQVGGAMEKSLEIVWRDEGREGAMRLVTVSNQRQQRARIRWVSFDAPRDDQERPAAPIETLTSAATGHLTTVHTFNSAGEEYLHTYYPIAIADQPPCGLEFGGPMSHVDQYTLDTILRTLALMAGMVVVCGVTATVLGVRMVGQPLKLLIDKAQRTGAGDFTRPVHLQGNDELSELAEALNAMCAQLAESQEKISVEAASRVAAVEQLRHADRLKTVGRLASGIAHELGTPLSVVSGRAALIGSGKLTGDEVRSSADTIKTEADRMATIIRQLLDFARRRSPERVVTDLSKVVNGTCELLAPLAQKRGITIVRELPREPAMAAVDAGQIQQVLTNLLVNAMQSMSDKGQVTVQETRMRTVHPEEPTKSGDFWRIDVRDQGAGIGPDDLPHIFEPFYTTKEVGEGTGLGLSIAYGLVREHGGWVAVESEPGRGSCFSVYLPAGD